MLLLRVGVCAVSLCVGCVIACVCACGVWYLLCVAYDVVISICCMSRSVYVDDCVSYL